MGEITEGRCLGCPKGPCLTRWVKCPSAALKTAKARVEELEGAQGVEGITRQMFEARVAEKDEEIVAKDAELAAIHKEIDEGVKVITGSDNPGSGFPVGTLVETVEFWKAQVAVMVGALEKIKRECETADFGDDLDGCRLNMRQTDLYDYVTAALSSAPEEAKKVRAVVEAAKADLEASLRRGEALEEVERANPYRTGGDAEKARHQHNAAREVLAETVRAL